MNSLLIDLCGKVLGDRFTRTPPRSPGFVPNLSRYHPVIIRNSYRALYTIMFNDKAFISFKTSTLPTIHILYYYSGDDDALSFLTYQPRRSACSLTAE